MGEYVLTRKSSATAGVWAIAFFTLGLLAISNEESTSSESCNSHARDADDKHTSVHEFFLLDIDRSATMAKKETSDMMGIGIPRKIISLDVQDGTILDAGHDWFWNQTNIKAGVPGSDSKSPPTIVEAHRQLRMYRCDRRRRQG